MPFRLRVRIPISAVYPNTYLYEFQTLSILPKRKSASTLILASLTISALMETITNVHLVLGFINLCIDFL